MTLQTLELLFAVNWLLPIILGAFGTLFFQVRGAGTVLYPPQFQTDAGNTALGRKLADADWSAFTLGCSSFFWRGRGDEAVSHERGHVLVWLLLGFAGHIALWLIPWAVLTPFYANPRDAYHAIPVERFCQWYGARRVAKLHKAGEVIK